jgi:hypothetical protein
LLLYGVTVRNVNTGAPEKKKQFGTSRCRGMDNIEVDLKEVRCEHVDWIHLAQDKIH